MGNCIRTRLVVKVLKTIVLISLVPSALGSSQLLLTQAHHARADTFTEIYSTPDSVAQPPIPVQSTPESRQRAFAAPTPTPAPVTASNAEEALGQVLTLYNQQVASGRMFKITESHIGTNFAYATAESFDKLTGNRVEEEVFVALLARKVSERDWQAIAPVIVSNEEYNRWLTALPDDLLDEATKAFLYLPESKSSEISTQDFSGYKLPWPNQQTAQLTKKDNRRWNGSEVICEGSGHETQLDFSIQGSGIDGDVYASKPGTVVFVKESSNSGSCSLVVGSKLI